MSPFFMRLSEEQQLKYSNAFMRSLANQANAANPMLGLREVVAIMDGGESLQKLLGVRLPDFLPVSKTQTLKAPRLRLGVGE